MNHNLFMKIRRRDALLRGTELQHYLYFDYKYNAAPLNSSKSTKKYYYVS